MKIQNLIGLCLILVVIVGCQTAPPRLLRLHDDLIEDGKTTVQEVEARLGPSALTQTGPDGTRASYYKDAAGEISPEGKRMHGFTAEPGTVRFKSMSVLSNRDGIVTAHWEYQSVQPIKGRPLEGGPRVHFGPVLDPASVSRIRHGETAEKDLVNWLGVPTMEFLSPEKDLIFIWIEGSWASSISHEGSYRVLSIGLNDRGTVAVHSLTEVGGFRHAMQGIMR